MYLSGAVNLAADILLTVIRKNPYDGGVGSAANVPGRRDVGARVPERITQKSAHMGSTTHKTRPITGHAGFVWTPIVDTDSTLCAGACGDERADARLSFVSGPAGAHPGEGKPLKGDRRRARSAKKSVSCAEGYRFARINKKAPSAPSTAARDLKLFAALWQRWEVAFNAKIFECPTHCTRRVRVTAFLTDTRSFNLR